MRRIGGTLAAMVAMLLCGSAVASARPVSGSVTDPEDIGVPYPFGSAVGDPVGWITDVRSASATYDGATGSVAVTFGLHHAVRAYLEASFHATLGRTTKGVCRTGARALQVVAEYQGDAPVPPTFALQGRGGPIPLTPSVDYAAGVLGFTAQDGRARHRGLDCVTDISTDDLDHHDAVAPFALRTAP